MLDTDNVIPIYKKGEPSAPQNHHPISLMFTVSKVLEHVISSHLKEHLEITIHFVNPTMDFNITGLVKI